MSTLPRPLVLDPFGQGDTFDPATVTWVWHLSDLHLLMDAIALAHEVVIDAETTGLNEHATGLDRAWPVAARVLLVALTLPRAAEPDHPAPSTFVVPLSHPQAPLRGHWRATLAAICAAIAKSGLPVTNHNLKFDLRWFHAMTGADLTSQFAWDTQIGSHLLDENSSTRLKKRAPETFGVARWDDFDLSTPGASERVPVIDLGLYAARDTYWTWRLAKYQRTRMSVGHEGEDSDEPESEDEVEDYRLGQLAVWCAMPTSATLTAVEQRGIALDVDWTREALAGYVRDAQAMVDALAPLYEMTRPIEDASFAPTSLWFLEWAERAVEAGDLRVMAYTPAGRPQWSKAVLVRQARADSEVAMRLLAYRSAAKRAEYLRSWLAEVTPGGTIHTTYNAGRVITGRLSSSDPNMQQVTYALKPAFIPRPGYLIADLDYSQIELRVAALISRSEPMMQAFRDGMDLHRLMAARITGKAPQDVTPDERQHGKVANFGYLYGMESAGFQTYAETAYDVLMTAEQAQESRVAFFSQWTGLAAWHEYAARRARHTGQVVSPIGRVRRLPMIHDGNEYVVSHAERQAINSPVQGFASDLLQIAAASIEGHLPGHTAVPGVRIVATVHDSIVVEVPADDWKRATGRSMRRMLDVGPVLARMGCRLDVPLVVEAKVGSRWGMTDVGVIA